MGSASTVGSLQPPSSLRTTGTSETTSADGEALDALVLSADGTFPGCWVSARPIGVLWITYAGKDGGQTREAKIVAVSDNDPDWAEVRDLDDVPGHWLEEISQFFDVYKDLEPSRTISPGGYESRAVALRVIAESRVPVGDAG